MSIPVNNLLCAFRANDFANGEIPSFLGSDGSQKIVGLSGFPAPNKSSDGQYLVFAGGEGLSMPFNYTDQGVTFVFVIRARRKTSAVGYRSLPGIMQIEKNGGSDYIYLGCSAGGEQGVSYGKNGSFSEFTFDNFTGDQVLVVSCPYQNTFYFVGNYSSNELWASQINGVRLDRLVLGGGQFWLKSLFVYSSVPSLASIKSSIQVHYGITSKNAPVSSFSALSSGVVFDCPTPSDFAYFRGWCFDKQVDGVWLPFKGNGLFTSQSVTGGEGPGGRLYFGVPQNATPNTFPNSYGRCYMSKVFFPGEPGVATRYRVYQCDQNNIISNPAEVEVNHPVPYVPDFRVYSSFPRVKKSSGRGFKRRW